MPDYIVYMKDSSAVVEVNADKVTPGERPPLFHFVKDGVTVALFSIDAVYGVGRKDESSISKPAVQRR